MAEGAAGTPLRDLFTIQHSFLYLIAYLNVKFKKLFRKKYEHSVTKTSLHKYNAIISNYYIKLNIENKLFSKISLNVIKLIHYY